MARLNACELQFKNKYLLTVKPWTKYNILFSHPPLQKNWVGTSMVSISPIRK